MCVLIALRPLPPFPTALHIVLGVALLFASKHAKTLIRIAVWAPLAVEQGDLGYCLFHPIRVKGHFKRSCEGASLLALVTQALSHRQQLSSETTVTGIRRYNWQ